MLDATGIGSESAKEWDYQMERRWMNWIGSRHRKLWARGKKGHLILAYYQMRGSEYGLKTSSSCRKGEEKRLINRRHGLILRRILGRIILE